MKCTLDELLEILLAVENPDLPIWRTMAQNQVSRSLAHRGNQGHVERESEGLKSRPSPRRQFWKRIPA